MEGIELKIAKALADAIKANNASIGYIGLGERTETHTSIALSLEFLNDSNLALILDEFINEGIKRRIDFIKEKSLAKKAYEKKPKETNIYILRDLKTGFYKIGRSNNPTIRERTLQSENPNIEMVYSHKGFVNDEKVLHKKYAAKHIRGEWYKLDNQDIINIKDYLQL